MLKMLEGESAETVIKNYMMSGSAGSKMPENDESFVYWSIRNYTNPSQQDTYKVSKLNNEIKLINKLRTHISDADTL
jgi:hypothetical protein